LADAAASAAWGKVRTASAIAMRVSRILMPETHKRPKHQLPYGGQSSEYHNER
jgi:hypothetical protein